MVSRSRNLLAVALGLALLAWLIARAGPVEVWERFRAFPPEAAGAVVAGEVLVVLVSAFSLWVVLPRGVPVRPFLACHWMLWFYSLALPRGLVYGGGMLLWIRGHGVAPGAFLALLAAERGLSGAVMLALALPALPSFAGPAGLVWAGLAAVLLLLAASRLRAVRQGLRDGAEALWDLVRERPGRLAACCAAVVVRGLLTGLIVVLAVRAAGGPVGWVEGVFLANAASVAGFVPLSPNGLGTVEAAATLLFGAAGVDGATVVAAYAAVRLLWIPAAGLPAVALHVSGATDTSPTTGP